MSEYTDTDEELAMANAYAKEGWAWVDDFCEALGEGTTVFNFKERIAQLLAALEASERERERLREALGRIRTEHGPIWNGSCAACVAERFPCQTARILAALAPSTPPDLREDA